MEPRKFKQYLERFTAQLARLSRRQRTGMAALLNRSLLEEKTAALIEADGARQRRCPRCHSSHLHRHGHAAGLQRCRCAHCTRTFNALTATPLARLRHRGKWLSFLDCMLASNTVRRAAALAGVHKNTSFRWRHRFLTNTRSDRLWPPGGITEADETYLLESQKGSRYLDRPPRQRGGKAKRHGLSAELVCILVARDRTGKTFDFVTGRAPLTRVHLRRWLAPVIERDILLVTDGHPAYRAFSIDAGITHRAVKLSAGVRVAGALHVQNVNAYHSRFKEWLRRFHGVASRYLPNYLGWRWALDGGRNRLAGIAVEIGAGTHPPLNREFGGFKRDCRELSRWLVELNVELVVLESTGIYWKSLYSHLERAGIGTWVVNAHSVKHVPGRKTDITDSQWLAVLARFGLVRGSFIPPQDLRELRLLSRYRRKLSGMHASEVNRLHKILDDGGIKLGAVVSEIDGVSAKAMVAGLIEGRPNNALLDMARGRLKSKREALHAALDGDLTARHLFLLQHISAHIDLLGRELAELDAYLLAAMAPYQWAHRLLQTIPGIDQIASALILIEIGDDMTRFGCADRLASWAALCPGNNESAGKQKTGKTRKGNAIIRYILCECANAARMTKSSLAAKYKSLKVRKPHNKVIVALAHKIIRLIYVLLTRGVAYRDPDIDYAALSAKKNAPRWIKQLRLIGQWPEHTSSVTST